MAEAQPAPAVAEAERATLPVEKEAPPPLAEQAAPPPPPVESVIAELISPSDDEVHIVIHSP